jgi:signal transduction histidine kinase
MRTVARALIVSSNPAVTDQLELILGEYQCLLYRSAEAALGETHTLNIENAPDLVIVHYDLNGSLSAPEVASLLSRRSELRHTWIVGLGPLETATAFYMAGLESFEIEPLDGQRFRAHLDGAMRLKTKHKEAINRVQNVESKYDLLLEDDRMKDRLTHMLVHDLKNPIAAVMGALDLVRMETEALLPTKLSSLLQMAFDESKHLLHLAANILDVRKMRDGKLNLTTKTLAANDFAGVLKLALGDVGMQGQTRNLRFIVPKTLPDFNADPEVLRRVFANLISNAVKHTRDAGRIQVEARSKDALLEITVRDDGEGIPAEDIEKIFADFERSRLTNTTRFDSGMGLAFCKLAIEQHGGRIWAESERGHGAIFYINMPLIAFEFDGGIELEDIVELVD